MGYKEKRVEGWRASTLVSLIYFLSYDPSYLWLPLGVALLWVRLLIGVIFITLEFKKIWGLGAALGHPNDQRNTRSCALYKECDDHFKNWFLKRKLCTVCKSLTSWLQKETPVERLFSRGRLRSRMERGWDLSSPSFSSSFLSTSAFIEKKVNNYSNNRLWSCPIKKPRELHPWRI